MPHRDHTDSSGSLAGGALRKEKATMDSGSVRRERSNADAEASFTSEKKEFAMSNFIQILMRAGQFAGVGAVTLGLLNWFFHINFIGIHMLFGVFVTLALLIAGLIAVFTREIRVLGAIAIVFALIVPVFGRTQMLILVGEFHWLIQVAHLLVGATAVILIERVCRQYIQIKQKFVAGKQAVKVS